MDKYEFNIKVEQIKKMTGEGDYVTAMKIADSIDWSRVCNANLLSMVAGVYEKNGEYQEAKDILLLAFERAPVGKRLLFKLAELSVKSGDIEEAEDFYHEFIDLAPDDSRAFLLEYLILKAKGAPASQLIHSLEQFTSQELEEKWLYELAELYARAGMGEECVRLCDKITLMFGLGKYSEKAMNLKQNFTGLSDYQMDLVENREKYEGNLRRVEEQSAHSEALYKQRYEEAAQSGSGTPASDEMAETDLPADPDVLANSRYANEDEAFEAYLRAHHMDTSAAEAEDTSSSASSEDSKTDGISGAVEAMVSYDDGYVNEGFTDGLSKEVEKLQAQPDETEATKTAEFEKTRILDESIKEKLRKVVIQTGQSGEAARAVNVDADLAKAGAAAQAAAIVGVVGAAKAAGDAVAAVADPAPAAKEETSAAAPKRPEPPRPQARVGFTHTEEKKEQKENQAEKPAVAPAPVKAAETTTASEHGPFHMIIEAADAAEGLEIAIDELKYIHNEYGITNAAAKTTAEKLNERGLSGAALAKLAGKDFIVEHAGSLTADLMNQICKLIKTDQTGMIVVLVDTPDGLDRLEDHCPELFDLCDLVSDDYEETTDSGTADEKDEMSAEPAADEDETGYPEDDSYEEDSYEEDEPYVDEDDYDMPEEAPPVKAADRRQGKKNTSETVSESRASQALMPDIADDEEMEIDDFAQYCCQYAASIDCSVTGKSMLALYERIELMEEDNIPLTKQTAEDLIEEAADRAEKPPIGKRLKGMFNSKYDKNGLLILREEDFIH